MTDARACRAWGRIETVFGPAAAGVDDAGALAWFTFSEPDADLARRDDAAVAAVAREVAEYGAGTRRAFDIPQAPEGGAFQQAVWAELRRIPFGETCSYGDIARALGKPGASRAVGQANNANPIALLTPCHRVIGADGSLTGFGGGLALKARMLAFERDQLTGQGSLFAAQGG